MLLGKMLRDARKAAGLTQAEAAQAAGVSARALWTLEQGSGAIETFNQVSRVLDFRLAGLPMAQALGQRIRIARERKGWTQKVLAQHARLAIPTVRAIENDRGSVASLAAVLAALGLKVRQRQHERSVWSMGGRDERFTPQHFLKKIADVFGPINLDPCAHPSANVAADRYIHQEEDGLTATWSGRLAFVNPPFSSASTWIERAYRAWRDGEVETVVMLCPVRTHTKAFAEYVHGKADVVMLRGRLHFDNASDGAGYPLGLMIACWGASDDEIEVLRAMFDGPFIAGSARRSSGGPDQVSHGRGASAEVAMAE